MRVFAYYIISTRNNGTIYKLVIIRILLNKTKMEVRSKKTGKRAAYYGIDNVICYVYISYPLKYFFVFIKYLVAHTKHILSLTESLPRRTKRTVYRQHLYQTIGI